VPLPQGERVSSVILGLVKQLQNDDKRAQEIAESAQKWAYRCGARVWVANAAGGGFVGGEWGGAEEEYRTGLADQ